MNNFTLLIAEDDDSMFLLVKIVLKKTMINIIRATNGLEAVNICKENKLIDLVLMDIRMPVMDGIAATKNIRGFSKDLPIIALTAYAFPEQEEKCLKAGCNCFMTKPLNVDLFLSKVSEFTNTKN